MYEIFAFLIFLILPLIKIGVTLENSHINSRGCPKIGTRKPENPAR